MMGLKLAEQVGEEVRTPPTHPPMSYAPPLLQTTPPPPLLIQNVGFYMCLDNKCLQACCICTIISTCCCFGCFFCCFCCCFCCCGLCAPKRDPNMDDCECLRGEGGHKKGMVGRGAIRWRWAIRWV